MKKKLFTLPELLVGIMLLMIVVNILAQVYNNFSGLSVQQATSLNNYLKINDALNQIEGDINLMLTRSDGKTSNPGPRLRNVLHATFMNGAFSNDSTGWPKLSFATKFKEANKTDFSDYNDSDGYINVMYHVYDSNNPTDFVRKSESLNLYRSSNLTRTTSYSADETLSTYNVTNNSILEGIAYFGFRFPASTVYDSSQAIPSTTADGLGTNQIYPEYVDISIAVNQSHTTSDMLLETKIALNSIQRLSNTTASTPYINEDGTINSGATISITATSTEFEMTNFNGQAQGYAVVINKGFEGKLLYYSMDNSILHTIQFSFALVSGSASTPITLPSGTHIRLLNSFTRRCIIPN